MKKYILAAALVLASTSAMADRAVSARTDWQGSFTKSEACERAKTLAASKAGRNEQVESYSSCDCDQNNVEKWFCSVDATIAEKH